MKSRNWMLAAALVMGLSRYSLGATSSETFETQPVRMGFQAGMTFSNVSGPADITTSNRSGLAAGVNIEIPLGAYIALQPELLFVQRGAKLAKVGNVSVDAKYNSLELPLLAKLRFNGPVSPFLVAGPVAIWNMSNSLEASGPGGTEGIAFKPRTLDFGAALGAGLDVGPVFATVRYTVGITDLDENSADWKSRGWHVLAGLRF